MKRFRRVLFWVHLVIGLAAGGVIAVVAFTGAAMAFEKQVIAWAEREVRTIAPPAPGTQALSVDELIKRVREANPEARPSSVTVYSDPRMAVTLGLGRTGSLYVNPYTAETQPGGAQEWRAFFQLMLRWHRWLGVGGGERARSPEAGAGNEAGGEGARGAGPARMEARGGPPGEDHDHGPGGGGGGMTARQFASTVVGVSSIVFFALCVSGLWLWWPRHWSWRALKATSVVNLRLQGKARDWNWHNAIGLWTAPIIVVISFTGIVMAFRGFGAWVYPRVEGPPAAVTVTPRPGATALSNAALLSAAQQAVPDWESMTLRMGGFGRGGRGRPGGANAESGGMANRDRAAGGAERAEGERRAGGGGREGNAGGNSRGPQAVSISVRPSSWAPQPVNLQLDPYSGEVLQKSDLSALGFRQAMRTLNRTLHTGEAGGIVGQSLAFLACVGGLVLVYTGFALAWRRFFGRKRVAAKAPAPVRAAQVVEPPLLRSATQREGG